MLQLTVYMATAAYHRAVMIVRSTRAAKSPQIKLLELEVRVLTGLAQGVSNYVIARRLGLTNAACAELTQGLLRKLGYGNRTLAAVRGLQLGLINFNEVLVG
ncbi:hypothetical protein KZX46_21250 (plasmid) [Polymorphobacter sp. PAMC 29334]|uniref:hypothetical protein n=1 Tax=Polymorphobacter sp. PAMC 29334 TaxID=2862331 RepID=UPI001C76F285|nr:hypothetical protein [Polymorphobacter sp. PAMC 29334]QYE37171.1 hypothetical protein KZX46_21250 [Polymorphobacter sp. PAMC 29334]